MDLNEHSLTELIFGVVQTVGDSALLAPRTWPA
jgi:hypothetical protein